jgi:tRNA nucleotidyltransferase (CCA-adding enzyme)
MKESPIPDTSRLRPFVEGHSLLAELGRRDSAEGGIYLAGGAVRDVLIGAPVTDIDLVTENDAATLALELSEDALVHERFGTAEIMVDGIRVDIATARKETYAFPGALPEVTRATLLEDLARRDFTINAMAIGLGDPDTLIDPHGGESDLGRGVLRVLHPFSFIDDPTRALRAARYAARFGFSVEPVTADSIETVDITAVSRERIDSELQLMSAEATGIEAFRLLATWGLLEIAPERLDLARDSVELLETETWSGRVTRSEATLEALFGPTSSVPKEIPGTPFVAVTVASRLTVAELLVNRAGGAGWIDRYIDDWSTVRPRITGDDLVLAGLPQGPAIGIGLTAALRARLDDGVEGIEEELAIAVDAAERSLRARGDL